MLSELRRDQRGVSLAEVLIAGAMASIIATAFLLVFSAFSRNVSLEESRAAALSEMQEATSQITGELRQAVAVAAADPLVETLDSGWATAELIFYSDRAEEAPGPERYRYYTANCTATHCDLMRDVIVADSATPPWTFTGAPVTSTVLSDVLVGPDPLFVGVDWTTGTEIKTAACDATTPCAFNLVELVFRLDPDPNRDVEEPLHVRQVVRLRNA